MFELLFALGALLSGGTYVGYRSSGVSRAARRARKSVRAVGSETKATAHGLEQPSEALGRAAAAYAEDRRDELRASTPVETLKDAGAKNVRWASLHDGGYRSLADVRGSSTRALTAVKGVGAVSAQRIRQAAKRLDEQIAGRSVAAPEADLKQSHAPELVKRGLDMAAARKTLGPMTQKLREEHGALRERLTDVKGESSFGKWIFGSAARGDRDAVIARSDQLHGDAQLVLEDLGGEARRLREEVDQKLREPTPDLETLKRSYREQHAEVVSVLEGVLSPREAKLAPVDPEAGTRLPDQIVQRVEALKLQVDGLSVVLRRYQDFGARFLLVQERTILGDDMGLGKTMQSLAAMVHLRAVGEGKRFLVVAPATVVPSWGREIAARTSFKVHTLRGSGRERALNEWIEHGGVAVTSYSTLRLMEVDESLPESLDMLVADEAHFLKNPEASRTQAVMQLLPMTRRVCLMTGTPIENRLDEFRMLVHLLRPKLLDDDAWDPDESYIDPAAFAQQVAGVYLRRNQTDVLHELPPRLDKEEWVELDAAETTAYSEAVASGNIMAMRRASSIGDWSAGQAAVPYSSKLGRLVDLVDEHAEAGKKVLVFSYFRDVLAALERRLAALGTIHGDVSLEDRELLMQRFRDHEGHAVLLGQITAAGVGLNLQAASVVVLFEPQWKPSTEEQAIARAHRMGQTERVVVHRLFARDSVDERIKELLEGKQELFVRYAKDSVIKAASAEATETSLAKLVVAAEQARLGAPVTADATAGDGDPTERDAARL